MCVIAIAYEAGLTRGRTARAGRTDVHISSFGKTGVGK
jgi:hypothetical protein